MYERYDSVKLIFIDKTQEGVSKYNVFTVEHRYNNVIMTVIVAKCTNYLGKITISINLLLYIAVIMVISQVGYMCNSPCTTAYWFRLLLILSQVFLIERVVGRKTCVS